MRVGNALLPHQESAVDLINGRNLIAWDMGLGKTFLALAFMDQNRGALPALVVCPAAVKYKWEFEASYFFGLRSVVLEGKTPSWSPHDFGGTPPITLINYDILSDWQPFLAKQGFRTIVSDECQNLSNPVTQRTKAFRELSRPMDNVLALSGTPFMNRTSELWSILNILWPDDFPSFLSYAEDYCPPKISPWGLDYSRSTNMDRLNRVLREKGMLRLRKEDVLKDLPPIVHRVVPVELSDRAQYEEARTDFRGWLSRHAAHKLRSALKAEALTRIGYLLRLVARLKLRSVVAWANRFAEEQPDEKLILFAIHHGAVDALERRCRAKSVVIDGTVVGRERQRVVNQFQQDRSTKLLIGNMTAAGVGTNLTASSEVGIVEIPWRPGDLSQAASRPHRIGQKHTVFVNYLIAVGTIEERLCQVVQSKQRVTSAVLDGGPVEADINLYDELLKALEAENDDGNGGRN